VEIGDAGDRQPTLQQQVGKDVFGGAPAQVPVAEDAPTVPLSPYGHSKLMTEQFLRDGGAAHALRHVILRYFNVAGADPDGRAGPATTGATHLLKVACEAALGRRTSVPLFGEDYPTRDGTCVRDYVHVVDLAEAHLLALRRLRGGGPSGAFNLGNGEGFTVKEIIGVAREVTGHPIPATAAPRRMGDPAVLIASSAKALSDLGWKPQHTDIRTIIRSAWDWHRAHPHGRGETH
jgi:UDP-glucose 4-epimerase